MALINNFIPTLWEAEILNNLNQATVFANLFNRNYEKKGDLKKGDKLKICTIDDPKISDYKGTVTYNDITGAEKELIISMSKYWAIKCGDIEHTQSAVELLEGATRGAGFSLAKTIDDYLYSVIDKGAKTIGEGTSIALDGTNGMELLSNMSAEFDTKNVPDKGRYVVVSPKTYSKLMLELIGKLSDNNELLANGYFGSLFNLSLFKSNSVPDTNIVGGSYAYGTFCNQLNETEAIRLESSFSTGVRGLSVFGALLTNENAFLKQAITLK